LTTFLSNSLLIPQRPSGTASISGEDFACHFPYFRF
jgi:hypothetical protein